MTTDKPKWWQSWIVYALVGLLLTFGPYVGGYLLLGRCHSLRSTNSHGTLREFDYDILRIAFGPLGWAEAHIRGGHVIVSGHGKLDFYKSGW